MYALKTLRHRTGLSQRQLAQVAHIPFRTIQLLEGEHHDPQLSTLQKVATALGYPQTALIYRLSSLFKNSPDSIEMTSERILEEGDSSWKIYLFNFVDSFRQGPKKKLIVIPPLTETSPPIKALLASTVETLCDEKGMIPPEWTLSIFPLAEPWFVSEIENLKAIALMESPIHFRKRNIFVLENFLGRA